MPLLTKTASVLQRDARQPKTEPNLPQPKTKPSVSLPLLHPNPVRHSFLPHEDSGGAAVGGDA
jgi:hypothetical protein